MTPPPGRLDVPRGGAVLRGLAKKEADLFEALCEGVFGSHFFGFCSLFCRSLGRSVRWYFVSRLVATNPPLDDGCRALSRSDWWCCWGSLATGDGRGGAGRGGVEGRAGLRIASTIMALYVDGLADVGSRQKWGTLPQLSSFAG